MAVVVHSERPSDDTAIRRVRDAAFGSAAEGRLVDTLCRVGCVWADMSLVGVTASGDVVASRRPS